MARTIVKPVNPETVDDRLNQLAKDVGAAVPKMTVPTGRTEAEQKAIVEEECERFIKATVAEMVKTGKYPMRFIKADPPYAPGQIAGFDSRKRHLLEQYGKAVPLEPGEIVKLLTDQFMSKVQRRRGYSTMGSFQAEAEARIDGSTAKNAKRKTKP